ncbi:DUF3301 domain-containing protein [Pseudidiomarina aestuarii]|uniref:DUF3301 domain-containing protein n=2 Tax=Pseudidiomarina aestuarii TaxID=624146 RepID=A0A7Z7EUL0_9GAMM|nr:DUF3301 domain-containing protein [Pseudidiomarina aestuarii]
MMLADVILLLGLCFGGYLFWQGRRQAEAAQQHARRYCQQEGLQFLDLAWQASRPHRWGRRMGWQSRYNFGFSSDGESRYEGEITLLNLSLQRVSTPPYRLPTE